MGLIRVALFGEDGLLFEYLATKLSKATDLNFSGWARTWRGMEELCHSSIPEVVLIEMGIHTDENLAYLIHSYPTTAVVVLAEEMDDLQLGNLLGAGARGYFQTAGSFESLMKCISIAAHGGYCVDPAFVRRIWNTTLIHNNPYSTQVLATSSRRMEILCLIHKGWTYEKIARILRISKRTVRYHVERAVEELGVENKYQAVSLAMQMDGKIDLKTVTIDSDGNGGNLYTDKDGLTGGYPILISRLTI